MLKVKIFFYTSFLFYLLGLSQVHADEWENALNEGSPRLLLYTLIKELPQGSDALIEQLLFNEGMTDRSKTDRLIYKSTFVQPLLSYDHNINGGIPSDTIQLGPYEFFINDKFRAKSGFLFGSEASHSRRYRLDFGQALTIGVHGGFEYSLKHKISKTAVSASGCYQSYLQNWSFLDLCLSMNTFRRETSTDWSVSPSIAVSKYFSTSMGSHEVKASLGNIFNENYSKPNLYLSARTVFSEFGAVSLSLYVSQPSETYHSRHWGTSMDLGKIVIGKYTKLSADYFVEDGSELFGAVRNDEIINLNLEREINDNLKINLSVESRKSTISAYDGEEFNVRFVLRPWKALENRRF
jgi:hypothetical protein